MKNAMKITAQIKLNPNEQQANYLLQTIEQANAVCNSISQFAFSNKLYGKFNLQKQLYHRLRRESSLAAQIVVRCFSKVSDSYKTDIYDEQGNKIPKVLRTFKPHGSIAYDERCLTYRTEKQFVTLWTVGGRLQIPYSAGENQLELLKHQQGQSDLVYDKVKRQFFLMATCDIPDVDVVDSETALGVDVGIVNIATTSDGDMYSGDDIESTRKHYTKLRKKLQSCGSKSAKRHLKKISRKQSRFQKNVNHCISKKIVLKAKGTNRSIKVENLTYIRERTTVWTKEQRAKLSNWSFYQLQYFIAYKARMNGVKVKEVDPAYTSQKCSCCGHINEGNRKSQSKFVCLKCGYAIHADINGAKNISIAPPIKKTEKYTRVDVNQPIVVNVASLAGMGVLQATGLIQQ